MDRGRSIHHLGSEDLSWYELKVLLSRLRPGTELAKVRAPGSEFTTPENRVQMLIADAVRGANWQRAGDKYAQQPEPAWQVMNPPPEKDTSHHVEAAPAVLDGIRAEVARRQQIAVPA